MKRSITLAISVAGVVGLYAVAMSAPRSAERASSTAPHPLQDHPHAVVAVRATQATRTAGLLASDVRPQAVHADVRPSIEAAHLEDDNAAEDEAMAAADNVPEQRVWRATFASERQDDVWTQQMRQEVQRIATTVLGRDVKYSDLSCRETVCRMYLQFQDQLDAQGFMKAPRTPLMHYEFQSLDPEFTGEGYDRSNFTYELLVTRPRPDDLPQHEPVDPSSNEGVAHASPASEAGSEIVAVDTLNAGEVIVRAQPHE